MTKYTFGKIRQYAHNEGVYARQENKRNEKFVRNFPHYMEWKDSLFVSVKEQLITMIGHI